MRPNGKEIPIWSSRFNDRRTAAAGGGRRGGKRTAARRIAAARRTVTLRRNGAGRPRASYAASGHDGRRTCRTRLETTPIEVIKELMKLGVMANINQQIDYDTAHRVATALGWETNEDVPEVVQRANADFESRRIEGENDPERDHARRS